MADDLNTKLALANFKELCAMLDENEWKYEKDEDNLKIFAKARGEDLPINITIKFNTDMEIVALYSFMPYMIPKDKRDSIAIAVSRVNNAMVDGSFDFDYVGGNLLFRMTASYKGTLLNKDMYAYMLFVSCKTIDDYNDKFLAITKQDMSVDELVKFLK